MKFLPLKDNALFLRNWRERMRPAVAGSACLLAILIIFLIFTNTYMKDEYVNKFTGEFTTTEHGYQRPVLKRILVPWQNNLVWNLALLQGFVILLLGTLSAYKSAQQERTYGVLDFHRASPTSRADQALGLLSGVACLEWFLIFGILILQLSIAVFYKLPIFSLIKFFISLSMCGLLIHAIAVLLGVAFKIRHGWVIGIVLTCGFYVLIRFMVYERLSFTYHLGWAAAYDDLSLALRGAAKNYWSERAIVIDQIKHSFFGTPINSFIFELLIKIPLIGILFHSIGRGISSIERPFFSKTQSILLIFFITFLLTGSVFSHLMISMPYSYYNLRYDLYIVTSTTFILGLLGALLATPTHGLYLKGLRRAKKLNKKMSTDCDEASNFKWLIVYCMVFSLFYLLIMNTMHKPAEITIIGLCLNLSYIIFFACIFEFFKLSRLGRNNIVFITLIIILWVLLPVFGQILKVLEPMSHLQSLSPFLHYELIRSNHEPLTKLQIALAINGALAIISVILAYMERVKIRKQVG